ncbi:vWA domain-containing protein [Nonomuraea sp. LPB2021202275-12-8]|uniref:vWA domain-containing protein n=1 Tax=Nonomuraea sp. LPB2021202275-12-8 TaxID=3120159 RepID=UPI00300CA850
MSAHLIADPAKSATAVFPMAPGWLALSAAMTGEVPVIADRDDLMVAIAPGAGHGAPACFLPARATIEVDGTHLGGVDPATAAPHKISDRARYATVWGLLVHECAHAHHTMWDPPPGAPPGAVQAALLLEEPRIEAAQIRRRSDDRHWLRASATGLILDETRADDPEHGPKMTARDAAQIAALLLGRTDGGLLTRAETAPVAAAVTAVLGADKLRELRAVWREALAVADDDAEAMIKLGHRWCEIVGTDPDASGREPSGSAAPSDPSAAPPERSPLAESITAALGKVAAGVASEKVPLDPAEAAELAKAAAEKAAEDAAKAARRVFGSRHSREGRTATAGTRQPTDAERVAARTLARALSTAGVRERVATKTASVLPPGRLRMRGLLTARAQKAAGALPTAEPFTRITRTEVPAPPLRLGIACDVSGSMASVARPVASAAWILAHAATHTTVPADTATVIFGHHVRPITRPGTVPREVTEFEARDNWEAIDLAIDALDGALGLSRPGAARLLVIISDGHFAGPPRHDAQQAVDRLRASGCAVLWLTTSEYDLPLNGVQVHQLDDPAATAQAIGRAATAALRKR